MMTALIKTQENSIELAEAINPDIIIRHKKKIFKKAFHEKFGNVLDKNSVSDLSVVISDMLDVKESAVSNTLRCFSGKIIDYDLANHLSWRIAGNIEKLKQGILVTPWSNRTKDEWVAITIIGYEFIPNVDAPHKYSFIVLSGSPCNLSSDFVLSDRKLNFIALKLGFNPNKPELTKNHPSELVKMRMAVLIERELSTSTKPNFKTVFVPNNYKTRNRMLMKFRNRRGFTCPIDAKHPCYLCPVGYDNCGIATHASTYVQIHCDKCDSDSWAVNQDSRICVNCIGV